MNMSPVCSPVVHLRQKLISTYHLKSYFLLNDDFILPQFSVHRSPFDEGLLIYTSSLIYPSFFSYLILKHWLYFVLPDCGPLLTLLIYVIIVNFNRLAFEFQPGERFCRYLSLIPLIFWFFNFQICLRQFVAAIL